MTVHVDQSLRFPDAAYFDERHRKTGNTIHHMADGAARTTIEHWRADRTPDDGNPRVATAYAIESCCPRTPAASTPCALPPAAWSRRW